MFNVNALTINNVIVNLLDTLRICFPNLRFGVRQRRSENAMQTYLVALERTGNKREFQLPLRLYAYFRKMRELRPEADLEEVEADLSARIATKIEKYFATPVVTVEIESCVVDTSTVATAGTSDNIRVVVDNTSAILLAN